MKLVVNYKNELL
uniref:Uncharacterized protein n=1 Tax=Arundo donax TaxID=35708 RepID=A0A0A8ZSG9_ARUDO